MDLRARSTAIHGCTVTLLKSVPEHTVTDSKTQRAQMTEKKMNIKFK